MHAGASVPYCSYVCLSVCRRFHVVNRMLYFPRTSVDLARCEERRGVVCAVNCVIAERLDARRQACRRLLFDAAANLHV